MSEMGFKENLEKKKKKEKTMYGDFCALGTGYSFRLDLFVEEKKKSDFMVQDLNVAKR